MKRILAATLAIVATTAFAQSANAQRRTTFGFAAGASVPTGDIGDATSTGYHALGTLAVSGTATSPLGFRFDAMYNNLSGKSDGPGASWQAGADFGLSAGVSTWPTGG